ncbi:MAG TPA: hypothetical protein VFK24_10315 [Gammaproteobacteria bacterium]|nr:hypothetical protein [Gammaproteobacteria bacterium]
MSLYGDLFKYRQRPARSPLEDFLTEALADILNRLPTRIVAGLCEDVLFRNRSAYSTEELKRVLKTLARAPHVCWSTQVPAPHGGRTGLADIVLEAGEDRTPLLVIENKVNAPIARRDIESSPPRQVKLPSASDGYRENDQLRDYARWLRLRAGEGSPCGLVLVSLGTPAPADFFDGDCESWGGVSLRGSCRWPDLYKWLRNLTKKEGAEKNSDVPAWVALSHEFTQFLEEKEMATKSVTSADLAAAHIFSKSFRHFEDSFTRVRDAVDAAWTSQVGKFASRRNQPVCNFDSDVAIVWDWGYLSDREFGVNTKKWHIGWGVLFESPTGWWDNVTISQPTAVIILSTDEADFPAEDIPADRLPIGWTLAKSEAGEVEMLYAKPLSAVVTDIESFSEELSAWVISKLPEVRQNFEEVARRLK